MRSNDDDLLHRSFSNGRWGGWENLGGTITSAPAAVYRAPNRIDVFVRGATGELVQRARRNGLWGGWVNLGGSLASAPAAVVVGRNEIELFARGIDGYLLQRRFDGVRWGAWSSFERGDLTSAPSAVRTSDGDVHVFARGPNGELQQATRSGSTWRPWTSLGGTLSAAPAVSASGGGNLEVFVRGAGNDLVQRSYDGRSWSGWKNLGGSLRGRVRARLKVLTHNVYGLGGVFCWLRGREFGWRVAHAQPAYDIVGLQEYYNTPDLDIGTCDAKHLRAALWATGRYRNSNNYYRHFPEVSRKPDGGVGIFTLHPIRKFNDWRWKNDRQTGPKAAEGFIFARIELPGTGVTVDTYVVHVNSGPDCDGARAADGSCVPSYRDNGERRRLQLLQLREQIAKNSRTSGNPVLVMGDFNIGGPPTYNGNPGHEDILRALGDPDDLWTTARPRESGYTVDCVRNTALRAAEKGCRYRERIDYLFVVTDPALTNSNYVVKVAGKDDVSVVRWYVDPARVTDADLALAKLSGGFKSPVPHVSDHFGVEATIEIRER